MSSLPSIVWKSEGTDLYGRLPEPRFASAVVRVESNIIYLFGGGSFSAKKKKLIIYNDLFSVKVDKKDDIEFQRLTQYGTKPQARVFRHACLVSKYVYLFGGRVSVAGKESLPGMHVFDKVTSIWHSITSSDTPEPNEPRGVGSSASVVDGAIFVFGGIENGVLHDSMSLFDTGSATWSSIETSGRSPSSRCDHGAAVVGTDIYIHGGCGGPDIYLADLYKLDSVTLVWQEIKHHGDPIFPRAGFTLTAHHCKDLYVFGGYNDVSHPDGGPVSDGLVKFSIAGKRWKRPLSFNDDIEPEGCYHHSAVIMCNRLYILCGVDLSGETNQVHVAHILNPSERSTYVMKPKNDRPESIFSHDESETTFSLATPRIPPIQPRPKEMDPARQQAFHRAHDLMNDPMHNPRNEALDAYGRPPSPTPMTYQAEHPTFQTHHPVSGPSSQPFPSSAYQPPPPLDAYQAHHPQAPAQSSSTPFYAEPIPTQSQPPFSAQPRPVQAPLQQFPPQQPPPASQPPPNVYANPPTTSFQSQPQVPSTSFQALPPTSEPYRQPPSASFDPPIRSEPPVEAVFQTPPRMPQASFSAPPPPVQPHSQPPPTSFPTQNHPQPLPTTTLLQQSSTSVATTQPPPFSRKPLPARNTATDSQPHTVVTSATVEPVRQNGTTLLPDSSEPYTTTGILQDKKHEESEDDTTEEFSSDGSSPLLPDTSDDDNRHIGDQKNRDALKPKGSTTVDNEFNTDF